jgi:hypothetical protein
MSNYNLIFNTKKDKNKFIITNNNCPQIHEPLDILIDYQVLFTGIVKINNIKELQIQLKNNYHLQLKIFLFKNFFIYKNKITDISILSEIIFDNFNIKNKEISYIYKFLSKNKHKKEFSQIIIKKFLN